MGIFTNTEIYGIKWIKYDSEDYTTMIEKYEKISYKDGQICPMLSSEIEEVKKEYEKLDINEFTLFSILKQFSTTLEPNTSSYFDWFSSFNKQIIEQIF